MFPSNGVMTWCHLLSTGSLGWVPRFGDTTGRSDSPPFVSARFEFFTSRYHRFVKLDRGKGVRNRWTLFDREKVSSGIGRNRSTLNRLLAPFSDRLHLGGPSPVPAGSTRYDPQNIPYSQKNPALSGKIIL